jgi:hypothetical protein
VPTGARSTIYTTQFICSILSQGLGPAIAALLFWVHGNTWDIEVGCSPLLPPARGDSRLRTAGMPPLPLPLPCPCP